MGLINNNEATRYDDDSKLNKSYIRIVHFAAADTVADKTEIKIQFAIYDKKSKWDSTSDKKAWRRNNIVIEGLNGDTSITVQYARLTDGVDIMAFCYQKVVEDLLQVFPTWEAENFEIDLVTPD